MAQAKVRVTRTVTVSPEGAPPVTRTVVVFKGSHEAFAIWQKGHSLMPNWNVDKMFGVKAFSQLVDNANA